LRVVLLIAKQRYVTRLSFTMLVLSTAHLHALVIRVYDANRHDRFLNFPSNPTHNPNFVYANIDLTGAGWYFHPSSSQNRGITMVSPIHFVGANHAMPGIGVSLKFLSSNGTLRSYTTATQTAVTNDANVASDIFVGKLNTAIPSTDNVKFHPYLNLRIFNFNPYRLYEDKPIIMLGKEGRGGAQVSDSITYLSATGINQTRAIRSNYDNDSGGDDDAHLEGGDSGSPVFMTENGVTGIVGTHSVVATSAGGFGNLASFTPYYVDKLNAIMAVDGYHMTKAIPGSTTFTLNHQLPSSPIRAGHSFTIDLTVSNTGSTLGENLKLTNAFPIGTFVTSATGTGWFDESSATVTQARKASLANGTSTIYSITLNIPTPGTAQHQVTYACDQFPLATENFTFDVIESFVSWASLLTDSSSNGDDDNDGIGNLLEYAFGGDPESSSRSHPNTTISLLPHYTANSISYIRRTDRVTRALTYQLKTSTTLEGGSWSDADAMVSLTTVTPIDSNFEQVTLNLTPTGTKCFYRIEVTLSE